MRPNATPPKKRTALSQELAGADSSAMEGLTTSATETAAPRRRLAGAPLLALPGATKAAEWRP